MKKALTKIVLIALTVVIIASVIPLSASASTSNTKSNKNTVYSYLTKTLKLNSAAACGIMANIEKESNFRPTAVIRDSNGLLSGGLCMWNGKRFSSLQRYCKKIGLSYLSIDGQMRYLKNELSQDYYNHIYKYLKNVPNTQKGAYDAAYYWCYYFEIPASRAKRSVQRGNTAKNSYWKVYGNQEIDDFSITSPKNGTAIAPGSNLNVKWENAGQNADKYKIYLIEKDKKTGKYDYDNSKIFESTKTSLKIKSSYLPIGTYKIYVYAVNNTTGASERSENVIVIKVKCKEHKFVTKLTKTPTEKENGSMLYTCKVCKGKVTKDVTFAEYFDKLQVSGFKLTGNSATTARFTWNKLDSAEGYRLYVLTDGKWLKVMDLSSERNTVLVAGLKPETEYTFKIKAFKIFEKEGKVFTVSSDSAIVTTNELIK